MAPEDGPETPRPQEAVEARAEASFDELDTAGKDESDRQLAEQVFTSVLELGTEYAKANPQRAKELGTEKILTTLTQATFKSLEKAGRALTPEQKSAVEGMVRDFVQRIKDGRVKAKVELGDGNSPQPLKAGNQPKASVDATRGNSLSVVKDPFAHMDAVDGLANQLTGNDEHDGPIMKRITELHIASTMYAFMKQGKEPSFNGNMQVGNVEINLSSSGDQINAKVNGRFNFQYSREEMKRRIG